MTDSKFQKNYFMKMMLDDLKTQIRFNNHRKLDRVVFINHPTYAFLGNSKSKNAFTYLLAIEKFKPEDPEIYTTNLDPEFKRVVNDILDTDENQHLLPWFNRNFDNIENNFFHALPPEEIIEKEKEKELYYNNTWIMIDLYRKYGIPVCGNRRLYNDNLSVKVELEKGKPGYLDIEFSDPEFGRKLEEAINSLDKEPVECK